MAGVRQHILPRFLLKGFAGRVQGDEAFTWVYRKGARPFEANTKNVAVEKHFYGKEGELNADPEITKLEETLYTPLLIDLRGIELNVEVADTRITDFITNLSIRTKLLRDFFRSSSEYLLDEFSAYISNWDNAKKFIIKNPGAIEEIFVKAADELRLTKEQREIILPLIPLLIPAVAEGNKAEFQMVFQMFFDVAKRALERGVKKGHIEALSKNLIPEPRAEDYRKLRWFVCKSDGLLILGDSACLFEVEGEKKFRALNDKGEHIKNAYLPISHDRILVGTSLPEVPSVDFIAINEAIAKCSQEYFVCSACSPELDRLHSLIGEGSAILNKKELEDMISEVIGDIDTNH